MLEEILDDVYCLSVTFCPKLSMCAPILEPWLSTLRQSTTVRRVEDLDENKLCNLRMENSTKRQLLLSEMSELFSSAERSLREEFLIYILRSRVTQDK